MSHPEEYEEQKQRIIEEAHETKQEYDEQHNALLEAAANDEELTVEETDTAQIGDATLTVKTSIKGRVMRKLDDIYEADRPPGETLDVYIDVLTAQTERVEAQDVELTESEDIRGFYRLFIDDHDAENAAMLCLERVVEQPVELEDERRGDAVKSFHPATGSPDHRGVGGGGSRPE